MNYISIMKVFIGLVDHSRGIIQVERSGPAAALERLNKTRLFPRAQRAMESRQLSSEPVQAEAGGSVESD